MTAAGRLNVGLFHERFTAARRKGANDWIRIPRSGGDGEILPDPKDPSVSIHKVLEHRDTWEVPDAEWAELGTPWKHLAARSSKATKGSFPAESTTKASSLGGDAFSSTVLPGWGTVTVGYRDVEFQLPLDWLLEAIFTEENLPSTSDTLQLLWPAFWAEFASAGLDWSTIHSLLGCYNLEPGVSPVDNYSFMFWNDGWGAPHRVFLYACALAGTYSAYIAEDVTGSSYCEGMGSFVRSLLRGEAATTASGDSTCRLKVSFINLDKAHALEWEAMPCGDASLACACDPSDGFMGTESFSCGGGMPEDTGDCGANWNDFELFFLESMTGKSYLSASSVTYDEPRTGCVSALAIGHGFHVWMHPIRLAFDGIRCDYALTLARWALGYALEEDLTWAIHASRLARFALRVIAGWSELLIHEIGHTYLGGGHCVWECCFEHTAQSWLCDVVSTLGLPWNDNYPDWTTLPSEKLACTLGTWGALSRCELPTPFVPGTTGNYTGTPCIDGLGDTEEA